MATQPAAMGFGATVFYVSQGGENSVVDSASIEVNRRDPVGQRRIAWMGPSCSRCCGVIRLGKRRSGVWYGSPAGSMRADRRQLPRARLPTQRDRTRVLNRSKGLLAGYGMRMALQGEVETQRVKVRQWDGAPLPTALRARLKREWQKVQGLTEQIERLETARRAELRTSERGGDGAGPPVGHAPRDWGQEGLGSCAQGIFCVARCADATAGLRWGVSASQVSVPCTLSPVQSISRFLP